MAIATLDGIVAAMAAGQVRSWKRELTSDTTPTQPAFYSCWTADGFPGKGAAPGSTAGAVPTSASAGAIPFTNPTAPSLSYLGALTVRYSGTSVHTRLYDRLVHSDGLSGTVTTSQTVGTPAITRPGSTGTNVECFLEVYTQIGATAQVATVTYTNSAGTGSRSGTATIGGSNSRAAGKLFPVKLQAGDTGVRSVQSVQLAGSTGTAGGFGVTLARRIAALTQTPDGVGAILDVFDAGMPQINDDACLWPVLLMAAQGAPLYAELGLTVIQG